MSNNLIGGADAYGDNGDMVFGIKILNSGQFLGEAFPLIKSECLVKVLNFRWLFVFSGLVAGKVCKVHQGSAYLYRLSVNVVLMGVG